MKRKLCLILALFSLVFAIGCSGCNACKEPAPELFQIYDRVVELIEASKEINTVIYGVGLPVYAKGSEYANYNHLFDENSTSSYEPVTEYAKFLSEGEIREAAEKIYSKECLAPFYTALFDGVGFTGGVVEARYYEDTTNGWIYASRAARDTENELKGMRIYDYSTLEIVNPSYADRVLLSVDSWLEGDAENAEKTYLSVVPGEDGKWYLDTFTG